MKILLINNYYYYRGGDCTYLFSLKNILEKKGHKVSVFAMHHPENIESDYSRYFVSYIDYEEELKNINFASGIKVLNRTIYSTEAKRRIEKLIKDDKPDIAHIQNIHHHLTPSIFYILKKYTSFEEKKALTQAYQERIWGELVTNVALWIMDNMAVKYPYVQDDGFCMCDGHGWTPEDAWLDK